jgi:DNA repair protein RadC
VTRDLIRAGQLLKLELLDHVIMGTATADRPGHQSMRALGYFYQ